MSKKYGVNYAEPSIRFIEQILNDVEKGKILVADFQREFVWPKERQIELFNSIVQGIPIGSIMIWHVEEGGLDVECYRVFESFNKYKKRTGLFLLDGLQRISSLYGGLYNVEINESSKENMRCLQCIHYNLEKKVFFVLSESQKIMPHYMPAKIILDSFAVMKYIRSLELNYKGKADIDQLINAVDFVVSMVKNYKIPVVPIATDDIFLVVETFKKINSQGVAIRESEMLHAITWDSAFNLRGQLDFFKNSLLDGGWKQIDDKVFYKIAMLVSGQSIYKIKDHLIKLSHFLRGDGNLSRLVASVGLASDFFRKVIGVSHPDFVPYESQIIFISYIFYQGIDSFGGEKSEEILYYWFWFTTYTEAFSGMSDSNTRKAVKDLESSLFEDLYIWSNQKSTWRGFEENRKVTSDFRNVRTKRYLIMLANIMKSDLDENIFDVMADYGNAAIFKMFSEKDDPLFFALDSKERSELLDSVYNRIICAPEYFLSLKTSLMQGDFSIFPKEESEFYQKWSSTIVWSPQDFDAVEFLRARISYFSIREKKFAESTAGFFAENSFSLG